MITKLNHVSIFVLNQQSAYEFYVNKLGFIVRANDEVTPSMRWITVSPPEQLELEISLMSVEAGMMFNEESGKLMRTLVEAGTFGFGVFECDDLLATYEDLKAKGVEFEKEPTQEFYGFEAVFKDDSGNWFSLAEKVKV